MVGPRQFALAISALGLTACTAFAGLFSGSSDSSPGATAAPDGSAADDASGATDLDAAVGADDAGGGTADDEAGLLLDGGGDAALTSSFCAMHAGGKILFCSDFDTAVFPGPGWTSKPSGNGTIAQGNTMAGGSSPHAAVATLAGGALGSATLVSAPLTVTAASKTASVSGQVRFEGDATAQGIAVVAVELTGIDTFSATYQTGQIKFVAAAGGGHPAKSMTAGPHVIRFDISVPALAVPSTTIDWYVDGTMLDTFTVPASATTFALHVGAAGTPASPVSVKIDDVIVAAL